MNGNIGWHSTLSSNLAGVALHWEACVSAAQSEAGDLFRQFDREWRVMAKDVLFEYYGGVNTPAQRDAYINRRIDEIRRRLTDYLHRPASLALAEALEEIRIR